MAVDRLGWLTCWRRARAALLIAVALGISAPTRAQDLSPDRPANDPHLVDVNAGVATTPTQRVSIGDLSFEMTWTGKALYAPSAAFVKQVGTDRIVFIHGVSKRFINSSGTYVPIDGDGSTLVFNSGTGAYTYTASDGSVYAFAVVFTIPGGSSDKYGWASVRSYLQTITRPNGKTYTYYYALANKPSCGHTCFNFVYARVISIVSSDGYLLKLTYATSIGDNVITPNGSTLVNRSVDYCDPTAASCTALTQTWPSQTLAESTSGSVTTTTITDQDSNTTTVANAANGVTAITQPTGAGGDVAIAYDGSNRVDTLTSDGITYDYGYSDSGTNRTTVVTAPDSSTVTYVTDMPSSRVTAVTNEVGKTTAYQFDSSGRTTRETMPEGNYTQWTYDARGNVTEVRQVAKSGSGVADIVETASYDSTCTNTVKCNSPNYTIDANGNRTDYTYDATHGGVTRIQLPGTTGSRPEINYSYTALYAQERNSSGVLVPVATPQNKVTQITTCATAPTCSGTANETKITLAYTTPNLKVSSKSVAAGDGSLSATETYAYDSQGLLASVDGPLSGTDDTTFYFYATETKLQGVIYPDPDGAGPRKRRAVRYTYNWRASGVDLVKEIKIGSVTGTTLTDLLGMTPDQTVENVYDSHAIHTSTKLSSGSTLYQVSQYGYDSQNRLECTALRMNPAVFASLPTSACSLGTTGSFGPDRIAKNTYDTAGRITKVQTAYGVTGTQADTITTTYTDNGQISTATDGQGNKTTYEYDGVDRLLKTRYPTTTVGAGTSSTTDYEQYGYDANSNLTSRRFRDGQSVTFGYDALNRMTSKDLPGSELDVTYAYDYVSRPSSAATSAQTLTLAFDALNRMTSAAGPLGTVSYQYDAAGRRTRMTWPDSVYVTYDWDPASQLTAIRENGASSGVGVLATYAYDDLGRRTSLTRGNGTVTTYAFDNISELTSLAHDLASTASDVTTTFGYTPSGQVASRTGNNDAYAWGGHANVNRSYTLNGLNQATAVGATSLGYDARGNLTSSGSDSFSYSSENLLTSATVASASSSYEYDPLLRVYKVTAGSTVQRFQYDGSDQIATYDNAGTMQNRYVFGPGDDEALVEYVGSGTSSRMFLHADERGSIVARSDSSGAMTAINSYDEYGVPGAGNAGRFQYTGQAWVPQLGMYYYKARLYAPTLGRFLQTDPVGYGDGMNWYNYVGGDPVNLVDFSGLEIGDITVTAQCPAGSTLTHVTTHKVICAPQGGGLLKLPNVHNIGGGNVSGAPQSPPDPCSWARRRAAQIATGFENAAKYAAVLSLTFAGGAALSAAGEVFTLGLDTPATLSATAISAFFGNAALASAGFAAGLRMYANGGSPQSFANLGFSKAAEITGSSVAKKFGLGRFSELIGDLAGQAEELTNFEEVNKCR